MELRVRRNRLHSVEEDLFFARAKIVDLKKGWDGNMHWMIMSMQKRLYLYIAKPGSNALVSMTPGSLC